MPDTIGMKKARDFSLVYRNNSSYQQMKILYHYITRILPQVKSLLAYWHRQAQEIKNPELKEQALRSLCYKDFHCQGGAVFAVPLAGDQTLLKVIVAYQTLCDYLDNLCDRTECTDGKAFRQLHKSLLDALSPGNTPQDYYAEYPYQDDNGYINKLVAECQTGLSKLPGYTMIKEDLLELAQLYISLQVYKHVAPQEREEILKQWANAHLAAYPFLMWQEFAAATGSTLAIFALLKLAAYADISREKYRRTVQCYFPWICGLHILLDYFIDQEEDRQGGDLNFVFYYRNQEEMLDRLKYFIQKSHQTAVESDNPVFVKTIIEGLLAMYLTDGKIKQQGFQKLAAELMDESGSGAWRTYRICSLVRKIL